MTSTIRIAAALLASAALAGCNLAPGYVRPQGAVPAALPTGGAYPAASSDAADISKIGWQTFFTDAKLREVIALGLANNRDLRLAAANVLQARAQYRVQRADLLPTVNLGASATISNGTAAAASSGGSGSSAASNSTVEVYSGNVGISSFELDLWGRLRNLSESALQSYFATEEAQRATRISLISEIASAYLTLAADQDLLAVAQETLASYDQSLQLTRAQFRIGTQSELAARQAETNYESAANDIATLRAQIAQDHNALDLLVGPRRPRRCCRKGWETPTGP